MSARPERAGAAGPAGFKTATEAQVWLAAELKKRDLSDPDNQWARRFEELISQTKLRSATENLNSLLPDKLIVQFVPVNYPEPFYENWSPLNRDFWRILASAVLLNLGASFWFNVLKSLGNLRPIVAKKQQQELDAEPTT